MEEQIKEKAILVSLVLNTNLGYDPEESLEELRLLAETAGAEVVGKMIQKRNRRDANFYIGKGKAEELLEICQESNADLVIFDDELSSVQGKKLEELLQVKVIDRTELILDIFAIHARTKQAKLQVELAQHQYNLPRLKRKWTHLERQRGGIGVRGGPGESQIEVDRRLVYKRISNIKNELNDIEKQHKTQRKLRSRKFNVSLIGYTNAGKTTLLNALADEKLYTANQLFATLDTTTRRVDLNGNVEILVSDTVGFIKKLPHQLVASFHATLEEAILSDLLVHVVDISQPHFENQINSVNNVLTELKIRDKEIIMVFNKTDLLGDYDEQINEIFEKYPGSILLSALNNEGMETLTQKLFEIATESKILLSLKIPFDESSILPFLYENGDVESEDYSEDGVKVEVRLPRELFYKVEKFVD
ncbi:GTPase HflX [bacterium]|nr:GTPase HflX [bacterium]